MKLNVYAIYDATYVLDKKERREESKYSIIELTEDEYFAFEKCEIEFQAWQDRISETINAKSIKS